MGLKLHIRGGTNLSLKSNTGVTSKLKDATFEVSAALTNGEGVPLADPSSSFSSCTKHPLRSVGHKLGSSRVSDWANSKEVRAAPDDDSDDLARGSCSWDDEVLDLTPEHGAVPVTPDTFVEIAVRRDFGKLYPSHEIGRTRTTVRELAEMDDHGGTGCELMLFDLNWLDKDGDVVSAGKDHLPSVIRVSVVRRSLPAELREMSPPPPLALVDGNNSPYAKRLMIVTRGTRGDIQPFLALARGLAELHNWEIIIVTEIEYKPGLARFADVERGAIRWRPSGGDTMRKVQAKISQKAINLKISARQTNAMQKIFLARSEIEFFSSEPAVFYWAKAMKPDLLMFGFTMASVTLIASEALQIPVMGFVLQPTSIPSSQYPPVVPLTEEKFKMLDMESIAVKHDQFKKLKHVMENRGGKNSTTNLSSLRERRGLEPYKGYKTSTWQELKDKDFPLIVPINETMFGGKPPDWSQNSIFTDCIFLRGDSVPALADDATAFIDAAKAMGGKIIILAFSSMPVSKSKIVSIALKVIKECKSKVCVFAMVGKQLDLPLDASVEAEAKEAQGTNRLLIAAGAPFGRLFPLVDAVVLHGGLGTTSEAIQAQVPAIVTGVLLLDQRFWGSRCEQLNVGPFGTHIDDFSDTCVEVVDTALEDGSPWRENAKRLGFALTEQAGDDPSGVRRNAEAVVRMSRDVEACRPYYYRREDDGEEGDDLSRNLGIKALSSSLEQCIFGADVVYVQAV